MIVGYIHSIFVHKNYLPVERTNNFKSAAPISFWVTSGKKNTDKSQWHYGCYQLILWLLSYFGWK